MANVRKIRRRGRWSLALGMALAALTLGAVLAYGDTIHPDGDTASASPNLSYGSGGTRACSTRGTAAVPGAVVINRSGSGGTNHYTAGELLDVTLTPSDPTITTSVVGTPQIPAGTGWDGSEDSYSFGITTTVPSSLADGTYSVDVTVTGHTSNFSAGDGAGSGKPKYNIIVSCAGGTVNNPPTVGVTNPSVAVNEGSQATNTGTYADSDGDPVTLSASYGTVTKDANGPGTWSWSVTPGDGPADSQTVTITATDSHSATGSNTFDLTVNNVAPTATFNAPTSVDEGSNINLSLTSASDASSADVAAGFTYAFDCGDGSGYSSFSSTSTASCATNDNGVRNVGAKIMDKDGGMRTYTGSVTVDNVPPTATFNAPTSVDEGSNINLSLTNPSDPSSADTAAGFTYAFDCGDDNGYSTFSSTSTASCATNDNGTRSVGAKIQDKDGGITEYTGSVTVNNVPPTATFNKPASVDEGSNINLSLTNPSDPSSVDTAAGFTYAFDCGDGSGYSSFSSTSTKSCPTTDNGTRSVGAKIQDKDGGVTEYTGSVTVNNVPPTVGTLTLGGNTGAACSGGNTVTLNFSFSDPGVNDNPWAVDINWGDGSTHTTYNASSQGAQTQQSHSYAAGGPYSVKVTVTDKDGGVSNTSSSAAFSFLYNVSGILQPINTDRSSNFKLGSTIPVKIKVTDCSGASVGTLSPMVHLAQTGPGSGDVNEVVSSSAADTGNTMRYDPTGQQYIFNLSTKRSQFNAGNDLTAGSYHLWITSPLIPQVDAYFDIRK